MAGGENLDVRTPAHRQDSLSVPKLWVMATVKGWLEASPAGLPCRRNGEGCSPELCSIQPAHPYPAGLSPVGCLPLKASCTYIVLVSWACDPCSSTGAGI